MIAQYKHRLLTIGPGIVGQDCLESVPADDQRIDSGHELKVAVGFATAWREKIQATVDSSNETVKASANKDGSFHCRLLSCRTSTRGRPYHVLVSRHSMY